MFVKLEKKIMLNKDTETIFFFGTKVAIIRKKFKQIKKNIVLSFILMNTHKY